MCREKIGKKQLLPERIYREILERIQTKQYKVGEKLPSEQKLAKHLHISRAALREALQLLERDGYIDRRHGVGTFVKEMEPKFSAGLEQLESMTSLLEAQGFVPGTSHFSFQSEEASSCIAAHLCLPPGDLVHSFERIRTADDKPFALDIIVATEKMIDCNWLEKDQSLFAYLEQEKHIVLTHSHCSIFSENASAGLAEKLATTEGTSLQVLEQVYYDERNEPVFYGKSYLRNDVVKFHVIRRK